MICGRATIDATTVSMHELGHDGLTVRVMSVGVDGAMTIQLGLPVEVDHRSWVAGGLSPVDDHGGRPSVWTDGELS